MPLVFVHGVNVRKDAQYVDREKARNELFCHVAMKDIVATATLADILSPYWGGDGANVDGLSMPDRDFQNFGTNDGEFERLAYELAIAEPSSEMLLSIARKDFGSAVDLLWSASALSVDGGNGEDLGNVGVSLATYVNANPKPVWLDHMKDDQDFINRLVTETKAFQRSAGTPGGQTFGLDGAWSIVKKAAGKLASAAGASGLNPIVRRVRPWLNDGASRFLGDAFVYIQGRGQPNAEGPITKIVADALDTGHRRRSPTNDPLIVVGHSMGGNICYDILSSFRPSITVDYFLTVGSQVGLFEELGLFLASRQGPRPRTTKTTMPSNILRWHNVFDRADILGFACGAIFDGVVDHDFNNHATTFTAHGEYFQHPTFYRRMNARMKEPVPATSGNLT